MTDTVVVVRTGQDHNFFNLLDDGAPKPLAKRKVMPMEVGIFPVDLSDEEKDRIEAKIKEELEAVGIEPLTYKAIGLSDLIVKDTGQYHRRGITVVHDNEQRMWKRRLVSAFVYDGNPISPRGMAVLNILHAARMPIAWGLTVWVPDPETHQRMELPDPMLVLELPTGQCIGLVRWNG